MGRETFKLLENPCSSGGLVESGQVGGKGNWKDSATITAPFLNISDH
jgi:hypothetical protein